MAKEIAIYGITAEIKTPYEAGHALTEAEAKVLNQVRGENIGNNCRSAVKKLLEEAGIELDKGKVPEGVEVPADVVKAAVAEVTSRDAEYEFSLHTAAARASRTPEETEALRLARDFVNGKIKEKGMTLKAYKEANGDEKYNDLVAQVSENEAIVKAAKKAVAERRKLADAVSI